MTEKADKNHNILKTLEDDMKIIDNFAIHFMSVITSDNNVHLNHKIKEPITFENMALNAYGLAFEFWLTREKVKNLFQAKYLEIIDAKKAELQEKEV